MHVRMHGMKNRSQEVTDGRVVRAGVSVTWNVLSWSGGHEFKPRSGSTWVCSTSVLIKSYSNQSIWFSSITCLLTFMYIVTYNRQTHGNRCTTAQSVQIHSHAYSSDVWFLFNFSRSFIYRCSPTTSIRRVWLFPSEGQRLQTDCISQTPPPLCCIWRPKDNRRWCNVGDVCTKLQWLFPTQPKRIVVCIDSLSG